MVENKNANIKQEYLPNLICNSCKQNLCNQSHLLYCEALIGSNQLINYIPDYKNLFNFNNIKEQYFITSIMTAILMKKGDREVTAYIAHVHLSFVCCCIFCSAMGSVKKCAKLPPSHFK